MNADGTLTGKDAKGKSYLPKTVESLTILTSGTFFLAACSLIGCFKKRA
ncbi:MAG: LPXTG cell wall anchor domain-containing protein [Streptococcus thermophilus]